jgi:hypothetical protein
VFQHRLKDFGIRIAVVIWQQRLSGGHDTLCDSIMEIGMKLPCELAAAGQFRCVANASQPELSGAKPGILSLFSLSKQKKTKR